LENINGGKKMFNAILWMVLSIFCFVIFNVYRYVEDKELNTILLIGLYAILGMFAFYNMTDKLWEINLFGKNKFVHWIWIINGVSIPISMFFINTHPKLPSYLITQFVFLTIVGVAINLIEDSKKNARRKKTKKARN